MTPSNHIDRPGNFNISSKSRVVDGPYEVVGSIDNEIDGHVYCCGWVAGRDGVGGYSLR